MHLLIACAGSGKRMGATVNKLFLEVFNKPILAWTLLAAEQAISVEWIGLIIQPEEKENIASILQEYPLYKPIVLIAGGSTRQESVYRGLLALPTGTEKVLIHDGARCLVTHTLLDRCSQTLEEASGLVTAIPVKDTIKVVEITTGKIEQTPQREKIWAAQTPQGFDVALLKMAHEDAIKKGWEVTDDSMLLEQMGHDVVVVSGEESNIKITTPLDLMIAEMILKQRC
ncbi:MAG: 2-C-methyl-D-erythritol 4-phosphate cytidylyltransferase [Gloeobacterales cyanobacterium]